MGQRILVLQHSRWHRPDTALRLVAEKNKARLQIVDIWRESPADFADFDALIILGGPVDVLGREDLFPFLGEERRLVRAWLNLNRPCLGFNLGLHLLAEAAGAALGPVYGPGIGFVDGHLTHEGRNHPLFAGIRSPLPLFKWHRQEILSPLPRNLVLLATSKECMVEACCLQGRPHIVGLQCDNYAALPMDLALRIERGELQAAPGSRWVPATDELARAADERAAGISAAFQLLVRNFFRLLKA